MAAIRGSSVPIKIIASGVNLTTATVTVVFAWQFSQSPMLTKSTATAGQIVVTYDATTGASTLSLTLADTDTATFTQPVYYTIYINDGTTGGDWVPDNGGTGIIQFTNSVKKV